MTIDTIIHRQNTIDDAWCDLVNTRHELAQSANTDIWRDIFSKRWRLTNAIFYATGGYAATTPEASPVDPLYHQAWLNSRTGEERRS